jgi:endonuclease
VRLVIARCSVDYAGRLGAHLPAAVRLIMVKADGCVAIHADGGAYKPLNWMNAPNTVVDLGDQWVVTNPKGETLTITLHEVLSDTAHDLGDDPGTAEGRRGGPPPGAARCVATGHRGRSDTRAPRIPHGDRPDRPRLPRRRGVRGGHRGQAPRRDRRRGAARPLHRAADLDSSLGRVRGVFVAQSVKPQARVLAEARGFRWVEVDYDELRGLRPDDLRLF